MVKRSIPAFRLLIAALAIALMTGWTQAANAATQTFTFLGGKSGKTVPLKVSLDGGATFSGLFSVGVYKGTLSAEPDLGEIEMFCADIYHAIDSPFQTLVSLGRVIDAAQPLVGSYYEDGAGNGGGIASAMTAADYNPTLPGSNPAFDTIAKRADAVSYLARTYLNSAFPKATLALVQLAIWDIVQDGGDGVGAGQGAIQAKDGNDLYVDISAILTEAAGQAGALAPRWLQAPRVGGKPDNHVQDLVFLGPDPVQICGKVFHDYDQDCYQDDGEPVLPGVKVILEGDVDGDGDIDTLEMVTDANGRYCFAGLEPGEYKVSVVVPDGMVSVGPVLLDVSATTPGTLYDNNDFCLVGNTGKIKGVLYCLDDCEGEGLPGVTVTLKNANGDVVKTTTTNEYGRYWFTNLVPGTYTVCVPSVANGLAIVGSNSNTQYLGVGDTDYASFQYKGAIISGYAFCDANGNGQKDEGEEGIGGVCIVLKDSDGNVVDYDYTDCYGKYYFNECLPAGTYKVCAPLRADCKDLTTPQCLEVTVGPGERSRNNNFGYAQRGEIKGTLYCGNDCDYNGLPGVTVTLKNGNGEVVATTTTNSYGRYRFSGLVAGTYTVCVPSVANGLAIVGSNSNTQYLGVGDTDYANFQYKGATITGYAFRDYDKDGVKDDGEPGLGGVCITLKDSDGNVVARDYTDCYGKYRFDDCLPAGTYKVYAPTYVDCYKVHTTNPLVVTVSAGQWVSGKNFGYIRP